MSNFYISKAIIPNENALESLVVPSAKDSTVIEVDYSQTRTIGFFDLFSTHVINITNVSGMSPVVNLPSNTELLLLFRSPQVKSVLKWIIETDAPLLKINSDDDDADITTGIWELFIQVVNPDTPAFNLAVQSTNGTFPMPTPVVEYVTNAVGGIWSASKINAGGVTPQSTSLEAGNPLPIGGETLTMDSSANYFEKFFGGSTGFPQTPLLVSTIAIINNTGVNINLATSGTVTVTGSPFNLVNGRAYSVTFLFSSKTSALCNVTQVVP